VVRALAFKWIRHRVSQLARRCGVRREQISGNLGKRGSPLIPVPAVYIKYHFIGNWHRLGGTLAYNFLHDRSSKYEEQIETIRKATEKALQSEQVARTFLDDPKIFPHKKWFSKKEGINASSSASSIIAFHSCDKKSWAESAEW